MKTALITGSTSGIGYGIAEAFVKNGYNVVINGLGDADKIEEERAKLEKLGDGQVIYDPANMLKPDEIAAMVAWMVSEENSFTTGAAFDLSGGRATY